MPAHRVIFYKTASGNEVITDFIRSFSRDDMKIIGEDLKVVQLGFPVGLPICDNLGKGLWEVRSSVSSNREVRLIFCHSSKDAALVVLDAFIKKTQKTPQSTLKLSLKRKREYGL